MSDITEQGQNIIKNAILKLLKFLGTSIYKIAAEKIDKKLEKHNIGSVKKLIAKNPNQGIHVESNLSKEQIEIVVKELKKCKVDYVYDKENNKLYTVAANKSIVKQIKTDKNIKDNENEKSNDVSKNEKVVNKRLIQAEPKQNELNANRMPPVKHKEIGAR